MLIIFNQRIKLQQPTCYLAGSPVLTPSYLASNGICSTFTLQEKKTEIGHALIFSLSLLMCIIC